MMIVMMTMTMMRNDGVCGNTSVWSHSSCCCRVECLHCGRRSDIRGTKRVHLCVLHNEDSAAEHQRLWWAAVVTFAHYHYAMLSLALLVTEQR